MDPEHPLDISAIREIVSGSVSTDIPTSQIYPSNPIITETLEALRTKPAEIIPVEQLSPTGQAVARGISETLKDTERVIEEKNRNDTLQKMYTRIAELTRLQSSEPGKNAFKKLYTEPKKKLSVAGQMMKEEELPKRLYNVGKMLITFPKFRDLLIEIVTVVQQLFRENTVELGGEEMETDTTEKAAEMKVEEMADVKAKEMVKVKDEAMAKIKEGMEEGSSYTESSSRSRSAEYTNLDEDQRKRLVDRFIELVTQVQETRDYQESMSIIMTVFCNFQTAISLEEQMDKLEPAEKHVIQEMQANVRLFMEDFKQLIENMASASIDDALETFSHATSKLENDEAAKELLEKIGEWLVRCLSDKEYIKSPEQVQDDLTFLRDEYHQNILKKYRPPMEHFSSQLYYYLNRIRRDPLARKLTGDISALTSSLFFDEDGTPTFKPELLLDLQVIVPAIIRGLRYIKIPDIVVHEPGLDFLASNIVINVGELAPHHLKLTLTSDIPESPVEPSMTKIAFVMSRIHADAHDICFAITKSGIPPLNDKGLADFRIFGNGMSVKIWMEPVIGTHVAEKQVKAGLQVHKCRCEVDNFELNVHGSGHDWMYYLLGPYIRRIVKERIQEAVENYFLTADFVASVPDALHLASQAAESQPSSQTGSQAGFQAASQPPLQASSQLHSQSVPQPHSQLGSQPTRSTV